jgi:hypothetical protein
VQDAITPARQALARIAQNPQRFLLTQTPEGHALLERILRGDPTFSLYRTPATWEHALGILAKPGYEGLVIDLEQRLRIASGEIPVISPLNAEALRRTLTAGASVALAIEDAPGPGGQILFKPIRTYVRDGFRDDRWEL